jgi:aminoglycoside phosphotransferase (APT) family kinase protein
MGADVIVGHRCRKNDEPWRPFTYWSNIDETTRRLARHDVGLLKPEYRDRIMHFMNDHINQIEDLYESGQIHPSHGDFAPGNLTMRGGTAAVLDWESSHLDPGPIDVAHYVSTRTIWRSDLANQLEAELWEGPPEVLVLAKIERLAGRANDTYQRRRRRDDNALLMLEDLVQRDLPR